MDKLGISLAWFGMILSVYTAVAALLGTNGKRPAFLESARQGVYATFAVTLGMCWILVQAFLTNDFSLKYVVGHSSTVLPRLYAATALWSGMEGSLTFWSLILAGYTALAVYQNRNRDPRLIPHVIFTLAMTQAFFLFVQIFLANPFAPVDGAIPLDGHGMNPQLQNPGMAVHPPMLYLGYVGCAIPFAFAMGALFSGRLDDRWIRLTRRWTIVAWTFLSAGILLGAWWAYVELGWGGYWAWDPVENASLMPWLTATAYLHSVMIQEKRGMLKVWNMLLVFLTFFLSVLGTFLTRSGFVQSVHSFAESDMGWYFLGFLIAVALYFLIPFILRLPALKSGTRLESLLSKEASFLYNNWLFVAILVVVLVGTLGEPITKLVNGVSTTFRAPYFNKLNVPLGIMVLFLTGVGPLIAWRKASAENLRKTFFVPLGAGLLSALGLVAFGYAFGFLDLVGEPGHRYALLTFFSCGFVASTIFIEYYKGTRVRAHQLGENYLKAAIAITRNNGRRYGGYLVHLSVVCMFAGMAGTAFNYEGQQAVKQGQAMRVGPYSLVYVGAEDVSRDTYEGVRLRMDVYQRGSFVGSYGLQKRFYHREQQPTTEVAIRSSLLDDLYLILISVESDGTAVVKAHVNPMVAWMWAGGFILVFGALAALYPSVAERRAMAQEQALEGGRLPAAS